MTRIALSLALVLAAGCAEKLTGPAAQSAAREYQAKQVAADKTPLILLNGSAYPADSLRQMNPSDIESIEVIKGAKAVELYGKPATHGAILVVTKKR
jgi:hypothetical protein